ncbi:MAG: large conductance mechanosensitive channel protein MscL [Rhodospirillaceae bacterium]|nr:large conductance mechanosensitive channel protein MscL [Rhodospirillaceae bacterium]
MAIIQEFREFAVKGNVVDLAVAVVVGGAFGRIVTSLVNDIVMPPIGYLARGIDFSQLYINLSGGTYESLAEATEAGAATINYGAFITTIINFLIVAWALFVVVRVLNRLKRKQEEEAAVPEAPAEAPADVKLLTEIRDLLKEGRP